jgi:hypothetical protein
VIIFVLPQRGAVPRSEEGNAAVLQPAHLLKPCVAEIAHRHSGTEEKRRRQSRGLKSRGLIRNLADLMKAAWLSQAPVTRDTSHRAVGVNLAVALCPTDTLAGVLLSHVPQMVSARRGLIIEGGARLDGIGILYRSVLLPLSGAHQALEHSRCRRSTAGR